MKSKEELEALKSEVETVNKKLAELTEDELQQVVGGVTLDIKFIDATREFFISKPVGEYQKLTDLAR